MNENEIKMEVVKSLLHEISSFCEEERKKVKSAEEELRFVESLLSVKGEEISLGEYKKLMEKKETLEKEISLNRWHYSGVYDCKMEIVRFYTENLLA
jgi:hypothetical protein